MNTTRLVALMGLVIFSQSALANTVWLKGGDAVCENSLSSNPGKVIGYGGVDRNGVFTLTISNPTDGTRNPARGACANLPATGASSSETPIVFNGSAQAEIPSLNMIKAGTQGAAECLQQGQNLSGISVTTLSDTSNQFNLSMTFSYTDGCNPATGDRITPSGQPVFIRTATLDKPTGTDFAGNYYVFNVNAIPEPSTMLLMVAGFAAIGFVGMRRSNKGSRRVA